MTSFFGYRDQLLRLEKLSLFLGFGFFFLRFCVSAFILTLLLRYDVDDIDEEAGRNGKE